MSSGFAWSLSKAYTLSFVGLYVTIYLSSCNWNTRQLSLITLKEGNEPPKNVGKLYIEQHTKWSKRDGTSNKGFIAINEAGSWNASPNLDPVKKQNWLTKIPHSTCRKKCMVRVCKPIATGSCRQGGLNTVSFEFPSFNVGTYPASEKWRPNIRLLHDM